MKFAACQNRIEQLTEEHRLATTTEDRCRLELLRMQAEEDLHQVCVLLYLRSLR